MQIDYAANRKLALVKQVYSSAMLQATNRYSASARLLAVIGFDWAAEGMIKAVLTYFRAPSSKLAPPFPQLIANADAELQNAGLGKFPDMSRAEHIHKIRNAAQHEGRVPSEREVIESQVHATDFLEAVCQHVWDISFQSVSMGSLIRDAAIRQLLMQAETNAVNGDYASAIAASGEAAAKQLKLLQAWVLEAEIDDRAGFVRSTRHQDSYIPPEEVNWLYSDTKAATAVSRMQTALLLSLVGCSIRDQTFFNSLTGHVAIMANGSASITNPKADPRKATQHSPYPIQ